MIIDDHTGVEVRKEYQKEKKGHTGVRAPKRDKKRRFEHQKEPKNLKTIVYHRANRDHGVRIYNKERNKRPMKV